MSDDFAHSEPLLPQVGEWGVAFDGVHLRLQKGRGQEQEFLSLNAFGYGAFTVHQGGQSKTYFRDGKISVAERPPEKVSLAYELRPQIGFLQISQMEDAVIQVVHALDHRTWRLDTAKGILKVTHASEPLHSIVFAQKTGPTKIESARTTSAQTDQEAAKLELSESPKEEQLLASSDIHPAPNEPESAQGLWESLATASDSTIPDNIARPETSDDSPIAQEAEAELTPENSLLLQSGQRIPFNLPITLKSIEREALRLIAEYGQLTDQSLKNALESSRPVRPRMSRLIDKLNKAGFPMIEEKGERGAEGFLYIFNLVVAERMGNHDERN